MMINQFNIYPLIVSILITMFNDLTVLYKMSINEVCKWFPILSTFNKEVQMLHTYVFHNYLLLMLTPLNIWPFESLIWAQY